MRYLEHNGGLPGGLLVLPVTSPLRAISDVDKCLDEYEKGGADIIITATEANRSPYFNMVRQNADGLSSLAISPEKTITRRQDAPETF